MTTAKTKPAVAKPSNSKPVASRKAAAAKVNEVARLYVIWDSLLNEDHLMERELHGEEAIASAKLRLFNYMLENFPGKAFDLDGMLIMVLPDSEVGEITELEPGQWKPIANISKKVHQLINDWRTCKGLRPEWGY